MSGSEPFMVVTAESGPPPVEVTGRYDAVTQMWTEAEGVVGPSARTNYQTSQPTVQSTNQSTSGGGDFVPDSYDDVNHDNNAD